jgi:hypothetical protein
MLGKGPIFPTIDAGHGLALEIAEMTRLLDQRTAGLTGMNLFSHKSSFN